MIKQPLDTSPADNTPEYDGISPLGADLPISAAGAVVCIGEQKFSLVDLEKSLSTHPDVKELCIVKRQSPAEELYVFVSVLRTMPSIKTFREQLTHLLPFDATDTIVCQIQMIASFPRKHDGTIANDILVHLANNQTINDDMRNSLVNPDVLEGIEMGLM